MWLLSDASGDPEDDTVMENHGTNAHFSAGMSLVQVILTADHDAQQHAANRMTQIAKRRNIRWWSKLNPTNGIAFVWILDGNTHLVDIKWLEDPGS
jgi:hypothetical protein